MDMIQRTQVYYFTKSGNRVRAVEPTRYGGRGNWVVERTEGASAGKRMIVPGDALVKTLD